MGCVSSKQATSHSPPRNLSVIVAGIENADSLLHVKGGFAPLEKIKEEPEKEGEDSVRPFSGKLRASKKGNSDKKATFSIKFGRLTEGEHLAAGWPVWLTAVACEAIDGWMPLKSNMFQKLEKTLSAFNICRLDKVHTAVFIEHVILEMVKWSP